MKINKFFYIVFFLFVSLVIVYAFTIENFIKDSEKNFIYSVKEEIKSLIKEKKAKTLTLATVISTNEKFLKIVTDKKYNKINSVINKIILAYPNYKNIWIHVLDINGMDIYTSWTNNPKQKTSPLDVRTDLQDIYKNPKPISSISVGRFDMTFKGIIPIYSKNKTFLGVLEVITHFNSIVKTLKDTQDIDSAVVVDKRFTKQLAHPFSQTFIDGYNISNINLRDKTKSFLQKYGINYFLQKKYPSCISNKFFGEDQYVSVVHIEDINHKTIGYFISFIRDKMNLGRKETMMYIALFLLSLLFLILATLLYKSYKKNSNLIESLNKKFKSEADKNFQLSHKDNLTTTFKREMFEIDRKKSSAKYAVLLNIKGFSTINSSYGFEVGDQFVKNVAIEIMKILDKRIYRLNIDEFLFLSNDYEKEIDLLNNHFYNYALNIKPQNIRLKVFFRFGICENRKNSILKQLAIALQETRKITHKNYTFYKKDLQRKIDRQNYIKFNNIIYDALFTKNEAKIVPFFQGIVDNSSKKIIKYEALARLSFENDIYPPNNFINIVKNGGFSYETTKIIAEKSIKEISAHKDISISINITEDDICNPRLESDLLKFSHKYGVKSERIILEILEGVTNTGTKNNIIQLQKLKQAGFKIAIDDFGVEYSNFERIAELDIDMIKIDGKYIRNILTNQKNYLIVQTITNFAHRLGLTVTAEFVENKDIYQIVKKLGIEYSQGYYFSEPTPYIKE